MPISIFYVLHVFSVVCMAAVTFFSLSSPAPERRKKMMIYSGLASTILMLSGFGLLGMLHLGWPPWVFVKIGCWLALSALVGQVFRHPEKTSTLSLVALGVVFVALTMVYVRPF